MNDEFDYKFDLLKQEIDNLQSNIRTYDGILFTVKGWSITIFSAFLFFAADKQKPIFLAFCVGAILLFWLVDSIFKSFQRIYIKRYNDIEKFLQTPDFSNAVKKRAFDNFFIPSIGAGFKQRITSWFRAHLREALQLDNNILYISMLIIIGIAFVLL